MTLFDFFQASELPAPAVSVDDAVTIAHEHFGLDVTASPLGSQQDANFLLTATDGEPVGVLKVANPVFSRVEIEAQDAAARFVADADPRVRAASNIGLPGVPPIAEISDGAGGLLYARIITYLAGGTMSGEGYIAPDRWAALGALAGRASRALAAFDHPGVDRVLQWDLQHADRTIDLLTHYVSDPVRRRLVETAAVSAWRTVTDLAGELPHQVIHCDITDDNVVCSADDGHLADGIIDFGDLTRSWAVGELAVTVSSVLRHAGGEPVATLPLIAAFDHERPLQPAEIAALWPLLVLRAATLVVSGNQQAAIDAENDYATGALELEWRIFERAVSVPADVMAGVIADALGRPAPVAVPLSASAPLLGGVDPGAVRRLDFSVAVRHRRRRRLAGSCVRGKGGRRGTGRRRAGRGHRVCRAATDQICCAAQ